MRSNTITGAALAALLLASAPAASAPPTGAEAEAALAGWMQTAVRIAPGVHVLHQVEPFQPSPTGNVTVIEQADGLVLVDSGGSRGEGERVVALVRAISSKPVKAVVLTHWHNDHPLGLPAVRAAWPGARVIATRRTAEDMKAGRLRTFPFAPDAAFDQARARAMLDYAAEYAANADKTGLTAEERRGWRELSAVAALAARDDVGSHVVVPDVVFEDRHPIADAERPLEVLQLGRSNTDGDAMVWLPRQRVLVAGDAVVAPIPYGFSVYPGDWIEVLKKVRGYDFAVLVPGHGLPQRDKAYVDRLLGLMQDMRRQVASLAAEGLSLEEVKSRADFERHRAAFAGDSVWRRYWFDSYWIDPYVESLYREARGEPLGPPAVAGDP